jgi:hypothetical protein
MSPRDKTIKERTVSQRDEASAQLLEFLQGNIGGSIVIGIGVLLAVLLVLSFFGF